MATKKQLTVEDFHVDVEDNDLAVVKLGGAELRTDRAGVARLIKQLSAVATVIR